MRFAADTTLPFLCALGLSCASAATDGSTSPKPAVSAPSRAVPTGSDAHADAGLSTAASSSPASAKDAKLIRSMMKKVALRRELESKAEVIGATIPRKTIISQIREHVVREVPKEAIDHEGAVLKLLSLIPTSLDYEKETFALLEAQIAGYYEPADKHMYLADDLGEKDAAATLAHELVHALQDQHYDLGARSKYVPGQSDKSLTTSCLAEGDAMSAMFDVMFGPGKAVEMPPGVFPQMVEAGLATGPGAKAPPAMKRSLVAPYSYGTEFVHALRREGGWKLVDEAWKNPPITTEQILHPDKWKKHEPALDVSPFTVPDGYGVKDDDTGGELGLRIALEEWLGKSEGPVFAEGWGGDRATLLQKGDDLLLAWQVRFDSAKGAPAKRIQKALGAAWRKKWKGGNGCYVATGGNLAIRAINDAEYVLVAGPTNGKTWQASADCAASLKIAQAAVASPMSGHK